MSEFITLFKHELKLQLPFKRKREKFDFVGQLTSILISLIIIAAFILLISTIVSNYVEIKVNKLPDPVGRALELLNVFYAVIVLGMGVFGVEKMRKTLTQKRYKEIFLRLPVEPQTIFLSKLLVLLLINVSVIFFLVVPVNIIFFIVLKPSALFFLYTLIVCIFLPIISFLISSLLIIPYILLIDFLRDKYVIVFLLFSAALILAFLLYSNLLEVIQKLLETGNIRFLFNAEFIETLQKLLIYTYPANSLASIALGVDLLKSILIVIAITIVGVAVIYFITRNLFYITLYKNDIRKTGGKKKGKYTELNPIASLMKKEFINVFREPANVFSYFAIASAMPVMVYSCYTLFDSLIVNTLGLSIAFPLALLVILIFSVLTNTFCATNISRDGLGILKVKSLPIKATKIVFSKVLFCSIVSSLAVIVSGVILMTTTELKPLDAIVCMVLGIVFSLAQIFIATKLDLNHAKVSENPQEVEKESNKTISKVVLVGLIVALVVGLLSVVLTVLASSSLIEGIINMKLYPSYAYIIPAAITLIYFVVCLIYGIKNIEEKFKKLVM